MAGHLSSEFYQDCLNGILALPVAKDLEVSCINLSCTNSQSHCIELTAALQDTASGVQAYHAILTYTT